MTITYTDMEIGELIQEHKPLPVSWQKRIRLRPKRGHNERLLELTGSSGSAFRLILRQNQINQLDFSIILTVRIPHSSRIFRLRRYSGKSHQHTNHIEGSTFYDFHIHTATERYQQRGPREDTYADPTDRYGDFYQALRCMFDDANFTPPLDARGLLI